MEWVLLSATGRLARVDVPESAWVVRAGFATRVDHDVLSAAAPATDGAVGVITASGAAYRLGLDQLPALQPGGPWSLWDAPTAAAVLPTGDDPVAGLMDLDRDAPPLALGTRLGVVKRVAPEYRGWESWSVIALKEGDAVVGAGHAADPDDLVFVTDDAQLLRLAARDVRAQGRAAGGMAGIALGDGADVLFFGTVAKADRETAIVASLAVGPDSAATLKTTPFTEYPAKGRSTGGVRTQRFLKGQDRLALAWVGLPPVRACDPGGGPRNLPAADDRRDGTGAKVYGPFFALGG